jgi:AraC-like DNA-binding protein
VRRCGVPHSLRAATAGFIFQQLRVGATLYEKGRWWPLYLHRSPHSFELEHGLEAERDPYNTRAIARATRTKQLVRGVHGGLSDLFVPVLDGGRVRATLVVGPFSAEPATPSDILSRWRWLTGKQGHPSEPEFAEFLQRTLETLVLSRKQLHAFERLVQRLSELLIDGPDAPALADEIESLRVEVTQARLVEVMWEATQSMLDERTARSWLSPNYADELKLLGLRRAPDHVLVGLAVSKALDDPVEEAVRRHAFQRRAAELARSIGDVCVGRVGEQGISFACAFGGTLTQRAHKRQDLMDRAILLGRRELGFSLHFGALEPKRGRPLPESYQGALAAADRALAQGVRFMQADTVSSSAQSLRRLRSELVRGVELEPSAFSARFDGYLETVTMHAGHRADLARAHLDAGFEAATAVLLRRGALDERGLSAINDVLERFIAEAKTMSALADAYRKAVANAIAAAERPVVAGQERSLQRALRYIDRHYAEKLSQARVAAVAGFSPKYFSHIFKARQRVTFEAHLTRVRIERAKKLLLGTDLLLARVAELSGFRSAAYFCHAFKKQLGRTPASFRRSKRAAIRTKKQL